MKMKYSSIWIIRIGILFCLLIRNGDANNSNSSSEDVVAVWKKLDKDLKASVNSLVKKALPMVMEKSGKLNLSSQCVKEGMQVVSGLRSLKLWALRFVDSSAKMIDGVLEFTVANMGNYHECIETKVPSRKDPKDVLFRGQFCTVRLAPPLPPKSKRYRLHGRIEELRNFTGSELLEMIAKNAHWFYYDSLRLGVCVPSGCSKSDLEQIAEEVGVELGLNATVSHCELKEENHLTGKHIFIIIVCGCFVVLVLLGTIVELRQKKNTVFNDKKCSILLRFSAITNFEKLISTKTSNESLRSLDGIMFLSITWLIMGHTYSYSALFLFIHRSLFQIEKKSAGFFIQTITNATEVMDTFLFLSGLYTCYITLRIIKFEKKKFNFGIYILRKLLRVWPAYAVVVLFTMLTPLMGAGPFFREVMQEVHNCDYYWWRNLIFINNFFPIQEMCMKHTWLIAVDFQLYLIAPIIILTFAYSEKCGIFLNFLVIFASVIYTGAITYLKMLPVAAVPEFNLDPENFKEYILYAYGNPVSRAGPYFIGVFIGYIIVTQPNFKFSKLKQCLGWSLAIVSSGMVIYATALWFTGIIPSNVGFLLYAALYKVAWTFGVAWLTVCCVSGQGGFVNKILSWKMWKPLSKLVLLVYLIQGLWNTIFLALYQGLRDFTHFFQITHFFGMLCITYLLAMVLNLVVEAPCLALGKRH